MTGPLQQRGRGFLKAISNPKWGRLRSQVCPLRRRAQMHQPFLAAQLVKGCCARSFTAIRNAPSTSKETSTAAIFPMPLPYPEVFQQGSRGGSPFDRARKKFVVCLMLADLELSTFQKTSKCGWAVCATTKTHWQTVGSGAPLGVSV